MWWGLTPIGRAMGNVIANEPDAVLIEFGADLNTANELAQFDVTLQVLAGDPAVRAAVGDALFAAMLEERAAVEAAAGDRGVADYLATTAGDRAEDAVRAGHLWAREAVEAGRDAELAGEEVPDALVSVGIRSRSAELVAANVREKLAAAKPLVATLAPYGLGPEMIARGEGLMAALQQMKAEHRRMRLADAPDKVRELWLRKGRLYIGLKRINAKARRVHAGNALAAAHYNLAVLHKNKGRRSGGGEAPSPT